MPRRSVSEAGQTPNLQAQVGFFAFLVRFYVLRTEDLRNVGFFSAFTSPVT